MVTINLENVREEIVNTLRNSDIFTTTIRGVTTNTYNFTATAGQTVFTLALLGYGLRNVRSVTKNATPLKLYTDYTIQWSAGTITLITPAALSDAIVVIADRGSSDKIFPDMPRNDLTLTSYPRIGMSIVDITTMPIGLYGTNHVSDILITIYAWVPINKDSSIASGIGGTHDLNDLMTSIRTAMRTNSKSFNSFAYITPRGQGTIDLRHHVRTDRGDMISGQNNKLIQASQDYVIKFLFEIG